VVPAGAALAPRYFETRHKRPGFVKDSRAPANLNARRMWHVVIGCPGGLRHAMDCWFGMSIDRCIHAHYAEQDNGSNSRCPFQARLDRPCMTGESNGRPHLVFAPPSASSISRIHVVEISLLFRLFLICVTDIASTH
jgi:hypothetical protein